MASVLHAVTFLWSPNERSYYFSTEYDRTWVEKLYRGFQRNLTWPFRFVCFTDYPRRFMHKEIVQEQIEGTPHYGCLIQAYRLNQPMILVGLDTVITGNIDHLARYCMTADDIALPLAPRQDGDSCNGVSLVPAGKRHVYERWNGENDVKWSIRQKHESIDKLWPGHVVSYKGHVKKHGLGEARIVFFHGREKPHELLDVEPFVRENWL